MFQLWSCQCFKANTWTYEAQRETIMNMYEEKREVLCVSMQWFLHHNETSSKQQCFDTEKEKTSKLIHRETPAPTHTHTQIPVVSVAIMGISTWCNCQYFGFWDGSDTVSMCVSMCIYSVHGYQLQYLINIPEIVVWLVLHQWQIPWCEPSL